MEEKSIEVLASVPDESARDRSRDTGPKSGIETDLAEVLADVMCVEQVSVDSHFFDDLGANSLVMAHFCARVRKRPDLPSVSMKDIYRHPTIRSLATALADAAPAPVEPPVPAPTEAGGTRASTRAVRPLRSAAVPVLPRIFLPRRTCRRPGLRVGLRRLGC